MTSLAKDRVDHASGSTIEPLFEVKTSARGSYRISLRRVVTGATPGSVAWKCSWWCLVLLRAGGQGTMDQDVTKISFPPMDAQGLVVKYERGGWVFSENSEIRQEDFLNFWLLGWKLSTRGTFPDRWVLCTRLLLRRALSRLIPFARCRLEVIKFLGKPLYSKNHGGRHFSRLDIIVPIIRTDPTQTEELTEWNGVPAMSGVGGSILEVVFSEW